MSDTLRTTEDGNPTSDGVPVQHGIEKDSNSATHLNELLAKARTGEPAALNALVSRLNDHLWIGYGRRGRPSGLSPSRSMSDLIQEALAGVPGAVANFPGESFADFRQYVRSTLYFRRLHWSRNARLHGDHERRHHIWRMLCSRFNDGLDGLSPAHVISQKEQQALAFQALGRLNPNDQFIIRSRLFEGMSCKELATAMRANVGAVRKAYQRAVMRLKAEFLSVERR
ncbi:MAG TPA: sigma-70 family RNA polymerase sigma factor [Pirellulales bacterium]|jgi:RNA polymerase sigma factor (sigma-70 family)